MLKEPISAHQEQIHADKRGVFNQQIKKGMRLLFGSEITH